MREEKRREEKRREEKRREENRRGCLSRSYYPHDWPQHPSVVAIPHRLHWRRLRESEGGGKN